MLHESRWSLDVADAVHTFEAFGQRLDHEYCIDLEDNNELFSTYNITSTISQIARLTCSSVRSENVSEMSKSEFSKANPLWDDPNTTSCAVGRLQRPLKRKEIVKSPKKQSKNN